MRKEFRWIAMISLLLMGALLLPLLGFPKDTVAEIWQNFGDYIYNDDYLSVEIAGPETAVIDIPIQYTLTISNVNVSEAATDINLVMTVPTSMTLDTSTLEGCFVVATNDTALEQVDSSSEADVLISQMWKVLFAAEEQKKLTSTASTVLYCELPDNMMAQTTSELTLPAVHRMAGQHPLTVFAVCAEEELVMDNNVATMSTEVKYHQLFLPVIYK